MKPKQMVVAVLAALGAGVIAYGIYLVGIALYGAYYQQPAPLWMLSMLP